MRHSRTVNRWWILVGALVGAACGGGDDGAGVAVEDVEVPEGFEVTEVRSGLVGPSQISPGPDGTLLVAQLNGGEGDGTGQVLLLDPGSDAEPTVLFDGLQKPTGVALLEDEVWVMEERTLSRGSLAGGELEVVLDDLPYNGRSEGTLSTTTDGRLLYNTSGTIDGTAAADGSGILWALTPGGQPEELARGFKHAYARTYDDAGTLWQTEMSDGTYDGEPAPDELVAVAPGDDFGWPRCIGDGQPVTFYEGTAEICASTPPSQALFDPGATPTSVAIAPWDGEVLLVALWNQGRVVSVSRQQGDGPVPITDFLTGVANPQHLLADGDRLLLTDFTGGRLLAITPTT
ncbi:MAG: PQQ-dependent sugar dehydrogenase [Ilumatobacteraceae bacterium]